MNKADLNYKTTFFNEHMREKVLTVDVVAIFKLLHSLAGYLKILITIFFYKN